MSSALIEKLSGEVIEADWDALKTHHERGALFLVEEELELAEVGAAIALDEVEKVKNWQGTSQLRKPSEQEISLWEKSPFEKMANFIIIQPYVIIQKIKLS